MVTTTIQKALDIYNQVPWGTFNWDVVLAIFLVAGSVLYTILLGHRRVVIILTSIYMTLAVLAYTPFVGRISEVLGSTTRSWLFIGVFVFLFFWLSRRVLNRIFPTGGYLAAGWQVWLLSFFQLGLLISIFLSFAPPLQLDKFSWLTQLVFLSEWGRLAWLTLPIVLIAAFSSDKRL
ncbi:MAG: hypothetical protein AAB568_04250 [Patescibacteria group bacterium]